MAVNADAKVFQTGAELINDILTGVAGDYDTSHIETLVAEFLDQAQNIYVVGDAKVMADLVFLNISSVDGDDDLCLISKLEKHLEFAVRCKSRKYAGSVVVIEKFSAEFQIQLVTELADSLTDVF